MQYDTTQHSLLQDIRHAAELPPDRYGELEAAVRTAGIKVEPAQIPDWPPVPYSDLPWIIFGGDGPWWKSEHWTGEQPVIARGRRTDARRIAREMAGPRLSPPRIAYAWRCGVYDPAEHVIMRSWLAEREIDIVKFLRQHLPAAEAAAGRGLLVTVANPMAASDAAVGSFSPTRRALLAADIHVLEAYAASAEQFNYTAEQQVSWVRAADDSRWEARRTHEPQSRDWSSHRSWISRPLGSGATSEGDVDPVDGWRFGPCMELFDDGAIALWIARRGVDFVEGNALIINGVAVQFELQSANQVTAVCHGQVPPDRMTEILTRPATAAAATNNGAPASDPGPVALEGVRFHRRPGASFAHPVTPLPPVFHRRRRPPIVLREPDEVRWWGEPSTAERGLEINGYAVEQIEPWKSGWRGRVASIATLVEAGQALEPLQTEPAGAVTEGMRAYSSSAVVRAIEAALGRNVRLFGQAVSDQAVTALTRDGLLLFLANDHTDRTDYVADTGGRNWDCENFSEQVRVNLARKHGVNSCAVIWGDGHAWCAFAVVGEDGPEIVMVEPQSDEWVKVAELRGDYSVERRAEVLL